MRDRLLNNEELVSFAELQGGHYPGIGSFDQASVLAALKSAHEKGRPVPLSNMDGAQFEIERSAEGIRVASIDGSASQLVTEFEFLDPIAEVRVSALDEVVATCRPVLPSAEHWRSVVTERPLSEHEVSRFLSDIHCAPSQVIAVLMRKWRTGKVDAHDLFPKSRAYYEPLVGPCPQGQDAPDYIRNVLLPYQERLLGQSLEVGLRYFLPAVIDPRLSPAALLADVPSDTLLTALSAIGSPNTPYALLAVLEIALSRNGDNEAFGSMAEKIIERLAKDALVGNEVPDVYQLMPPLVRACLRWISVEEEFWGTPPYWRRLVAFAHASLLLEILTTKPLDADSFTAWCESLETPGMVAAELLDMQQEPLWRADDLSPVTLRAAIIGRLGAFGLMAQSAGANIPNWDQVEAVVKQLKAQGRLIFTAYPGPLDGGQRLMYAEHAERTDGPGVSEVLRQLTGEIEADPVSPAWSGLSRSSRLLQFDQDLLAALENALNNSILGEGDEAVERFFEAQASAAYIAAAQPCEPLADAVAVCLVREASKFPSPRDAEAGYRVMLMASAAFADRGKWLEWLGRRLADYAFSLPRGASCLQLSTSLQVLQAFFPLRERCFGRARKFASSGL